MKFAIVPQYSIPQTRIDLGILKTKAANLSFQSLFECGPFYESCIKLECFVHTCFNSSYSDIYGCIKLCTVENFIIYQLCNVSRIISFQCFKILTILFVSLLCLYFGFLHCNVLNMKDIFCPGFRHLFLLSQCSNSG